VQKRGHLEKLIRNTWKVLKFGADEVWRRSPGPIVLEIKKYYQSKRGKEYPANNKKKEC
jgi:hypothetical protein